MVENTPHTYIGLRRETLAGNSILTQEIRKTVHLQGAGLPTRKGLEGPISLLRYVSK